MSQRKKTKEDVFSACLVTIERHGWKNFSFAKASEETEIPLAVFYKYFTSSSDVIAYLFHKIDTEILANRDFFENDSLKDALFDILMARFEAAAPYKGILQSFWQDWIFSPEELPHLASQGFTSMAWMLEAAQLNNRGLKGFLRIQGLATLYLLTLKTWLSDDSPDLGKTMVYLDKGLSRLEKLASMLSILEN